MEGVEFCRGREYQRTVEGDARRLGGRAARFGVEFAFGDSMVVRKKQKGDKREGENCILVRDYCKYMIWVLADASREESRKLGMKERSKLNCLEDATPMAPSTILLKECYSCKR